MDIKEYLEGFRKVKIAANRQLDRYYINKFGAIIALKRRTLQILKPKLADNGYYCVGLRDETGERKYYSIHRLVALTFLKNPRGNKKYVNHIDGDKTNNYVGNLEWVTARENALHAIEHGLCDIYLRSGTLYKSGVEIGEFKKLKDASEYVARECNCSVDTVRKWLTGTSLIENPGKYSEYSYISNLECL